MKYHKYVFFILKVVCKNICIKPFDAYVYLMRMCKEYFTLYLCTDTSFLLTPVTGDELCIFYSTSFFKCSLCLLNWFQNPITASRYF